MKKLPVCSRPSEKGRGCAPRPPFPDDGRIFAPFLLPTSPFSGRQAHLRHKKVFPQEVKGFKAYLSNGKETRADVMVAGKWLTVRGLGELIPLDLMSIRYVYPLIIRRLSATVRFLFFDCNGGREDLLKKL